MVERLNFVQVLIVDDHPVVRVGLRTMLASEESISVKGVAGRRGAIRQVASLQPALPILERVVGCVEQNSALPLPLSVLEKELTAAEPG